jgi:hypothetical protein
LMHLQIGNTINSIHLLLYYNVNITGLKDNSFVINNCW